MADGSKQAAKQTGPEAEQPSQVRFWEPRGDQCWVLNLDTICLSVEPTEEGLDWSAMVEVPNAADIEEYFDSLEAAKEYCEEKAKELLRKDLKSLGGGE